jgi:copper chaperone
MRGILIPTMQVLRYSVPEMHCAHCKDALEHEISTVEGVESVEADLASRIVSVSGQNVSSEAVREAIEEAGYEAA